MSLFLCPLCQKNLLQQDNSLRCETGHCFDLAAEGYSYLLPVNRKHSKMPGDDKAMVAGRSAFLSAGYYAPLLRQLQALALSLTGAEAAIFDSGCGEGYYSDGIFRALTESGRRVRMAGIDISKFAVRRAAKRNRAIEFAVASAYQLPVAEESFDLLLNCFSPLAVEEFHRVLKPGGHFLYVVPAARHLWGLKQVLYEKPYLNEEKLTPYPGFSYVEVRRVEDTIRLQDKEHIRALLQMTPYAWKTPKEGVARLLALEELETEIAFDVHVFRKEAAR